MLSHERFDEPGAHPDVEDHRLASRDRPVRAYPDKVRSAVRPGSSGVYAQVAALLHESRREAPDQLGSFLARRVVPFGMRDLSVYVTDFEQRRLVPIVGSVATSSIDMDGTTGGRSFTTARHVAERMSACCPALPNSCGDAPPAPTTRASGRVTSPVGVANWVSRTSES